MPAIENSTVIKRVLQTLINVSSRKTTDNYAFTTLNTLITQLKQKYDFLKNIEIKDIQYLEENNSITVMSAMNSVPPTEIGKALTAIISTMTQSLGKNAGHFFIKEIQRNLEEEYSSAITDMGVDLNLMQLEFEVTQMEKDVTRMQKTI